MFNENSITVKSWVNQIRLGKRTREEIPNLSNLREVVLSVLDQE